MAHRHDSSPDETLWQATNVDIPALQQIVCVHFRSESRTYTRMDDGAYARVFLFSLENNMQVVARVILPIRESLKTEAEVVAMEVVRGEIAAVVSILELITYSFYIARTSIPVPQVYLYCSTPHNPVRAEWILMQYMPGVRLGDCIENLTDSQKHQTGMDLATIMFSLFQITAPKCGSLVRSGYQDDSCLRYRSLRYPICRPKDTQGQNPSKAPAVPKEHFSVGPVNDISFLDYPRQLPLELCGPFNTERDWMEAFAFGGKVRHEPLTEEWKKLELWAFEKTLEVYDVVAEFYQRSSHSTFNESGMFHLAHGDFSSYNILIDPDTGAITGLIDWEMAGFRPAWLAAVGGGWFNDDSERFLMTDDQSSRDNYAEETPTDAITRASFRLRLAALDEELFGHYLLGLELRALFYACCNEFAGNAEIWLIKYEEHEWSVKQRGSFPFDVMAWVKERAVLEHRFVVQTHPICITAVTNVRV